MKKTIFAFLFSLILPSYAHAAYQEYYSIPEKKTAMQVMGRGLANIGGLPAEIGTTLVREHQAHGRAWPVTYPFRLATNSIYRVFSGINDAVIFPWIVPLATDTSPLTKGLGIPDYPWNVA